MQNSIKGVFLLKREINNKVSLTNKETNSYDLIDYFEFERMLKQHFSIDKSNKILDCINCSQKVIIDFDKSIAKLIKEKDYDFRDVMKSYMNSTNVENELNNPFDDDDIYSRFQNL